MNYIAEINQFYDRLETNPLSSNAIALWHALMATANKAKGFHEKKHSITRSEHEERTKKAQKDIEEFKKIYPVIPTDKPIQEYWELWKKRDSETIDYLYKCNRK